jgi:hypothetical protein
MSPPFTAKINHNGFTHEEQFRSKVDAAEWAAMVDQTLDDDVKISFDLAAYAAGLAEAVRMFGGGYMRTAWLSGHVAPEQWSKHDPVGAYKLAMKIAASTTASPLKS